MKGDQLMAPISRERRNAWIKLIETTDMSKNSKQKAWALIRKLGNDPMKTEQHTNVTANQVAHQLLLNGRPKRRNTSKPKLNRTRDDPGFTKPFTMLELESGISSLKSGKAILLDNIATEQIKHL